MTNKEAINLIQAIEEDGRNVTTEHIEALVLAIKALKKDKCSTCKHYDKEYGETCPNCGADMRGTEK